MSINTVIRVKTIKYVIKLLTIGGRIIERASKTQAQLVVRSCVVGNFSSTIVQYKPATIIKQRMRDNLWCFQTSQH